MYSPTRQSSCGVSPFVVTSRIYGLESEESWRRSGIDGALAHRHPTGSAVASGTIQVSIALEPSLGRTSRGGGGRCSRGGCGGVRPQADEKDVHFSMAPRVRFDASIPGTEADGPAEKRLVRRDRHLGKATAPVPQRVARLLQEEDVAAARAATRHTVAGGECKSLSAEIEARYNMTAARRAQTAELFTAALQAVEAVQDFIRCYRSPAAYATVSTALVTGTAPVVNGGRKTEKLLAVGIYRTARSFHRVAELQPLPQLRLAGQLVEIRSFVHREWLRLLESEDAPGLNSLDSEVWDSDSGSYLARLLQKYDWAWDEKLQRFAFQSTPDVESLATKLKLLCGAPLVAPSSQEQKDEEDEEEDWQDWDWQDADWTAWCGEDQWTEQEWCEWQETSADAEIPTEWQAKKKRLDSPGRISEVRTVPPEIARPPYVPHEDVELDARTGLPKHPFMYMQEVKTPEQVQAMRKAGALAREALAVTPKRNYNGDYRSQALSNPESLLGAQIRVVTTFGEEIEGELFCVDIGGSNSVVLCQRLDNGRVNYKWTKMNIIREVVAMAGPPSTGAEEAARTAARYGVGVTEQAQDCFDALSKTMQTEWDGEDIICMGCRIAKPYDPNKNISGGEPKTLERVKKVLQEELARMQKKTGK
ncbi:hypothetical protein AK812_SmicGene31939 [Symbiodinium microadriaticum]|uniref:AD domain-containing protein n=2 Tax=Symbiodinium microadriaticum TaxID=2951 RepID=A0A1Q9CVG0_SYMMI|nr:hypothetical protein AK812_SmicGene31939 [Symbiodinium microadriaticum]